MDLTIKVPCDLEVPANSLNSTETTLEEIPALEKLYATFFRAPPAATEFLTSFIVNARGGVMRASHQKGVYVIIPENACKQPTYLTVHWVQPRRIQNLPILMDGEGVISRILQISPIEVYFLRPIIFVIPHFGLLHGREREVVILRSDNGKTWNEHQFKESTSGAKDVLNFKLTNLLKYIQSMQTGSFVGIVTRTLPKFFAVISRMRQDVLSIDSNGGTVSSEFMPQVQVTFPPQAVSKKILVGLQVRAFNLKEWARLNRMVVSPIVIIEPRCRKFRKPITVRMPFSQIGFHDYTFNHCILNKTNIRLLYSMRNDQHSAIWKDVTGSTLLSYENNCILFTTKISGRYWLIGCKSTEDVHNIALKLYKYMMHMPYLAKIIVYTKRISQKEAKLSVEFLIDYRHKKVIENEGSWNKVASIEDIEIFDNQQIYLKFTNFTPIVMEDKELSFRFIAFQNSNLNFAVNILNPNNLTDCISFMNVNTIFKKVICTLDISLK